MLSLEEKKSLLGLARETILSSLSGKRERVSLPETPALSSRRALFVTLTLEGELRGCIGRTEPQAPLSQLVAEMARAAAFHDPRFPPLTLPELSKAEIEISVLSPLKRVKEVRTLQIGKHGLLIRQGSSSGLLLPQVAVSHGWSIEEFLGQVCLKAGLFKEAWREEGSELFSFTTEVFSE